MDIIQLLILLVLLGVGVWAARKWVPNPIGNIIVIVLCIIAIIFVLEAFGLLSVLHSPVPKL